MRTSARTWYSVVLFGFCVASVLALKPRCMFRADGSLYAFGTGSDRSVFSFGTCVAALAVVCGFVFAMADLLGEPEGAFPAPLAPATASFPAPVAFPAPLAFPPGALGPAPSPPPGAVRYLAPPSPAPACVFAVPDPFALDSAPFGI